MKNLTLEQIEMIGSLLHEHIQFYDSQGQEANNTVIAEIESHLKAFPLVDFEGVDHDDR